MVHPQPLPGVQAQPRGIGRLGQVVLSVLGGLLIAVCGVVITVVLLLTVGPGVFGTALLLASLPVLPLVWVYRWLDRHEPEPRGMLLFAFGWGAAVATAFSLLLSLPPTLAVQAAGGDADTVGAVFVAPLVEEGLKALGLLAALLVGRRALDGLVDGFVYSGMVGIGFAFTENILYLGNALITAAPTGSWPRSSCAGWCPRSPTRCSPPRPGSVWSWRRGGAGRLGRCWGSSGSGSRCCCTASGTAWPSAGSQASPPPTW
jgi:hypothetical protein